MSSSHTTGRPAPTGTFELPIRSASGPQGSSCPSSSEHDVLTNFEVNDDHSSSGVEDLHEEDPVPSDDFDRPDDSDDSDKSDDSSFMDTIQASVRQNLHLVYALAQDSLARAERMVAASEGKHQDALKQLKEEKQRADAAEMRADKAEADLADAKEEFERHLDTEIAGRKKNEKELRQLRSLMGASAVAAAKSNKRKA